ncbi:hypothetical protein BDR07DRAFT_501050 [Suillus spraguei]|nr:hypothetical protein BDR07DRAFT_781580 [Suillus spraguei]KAG2366397.1 hypothetical protein BDR07DRAFT_501050 [Suillus spraguei]
MSFSLSWSIVGLVRGEQPPLQLSKRPVSAPTDLPSEVFLLELHYFCTLSCERILCTIPATLWSQYHVQWSIVSA